MYAHISQIFDTHPPLSTNFSKAMTSLKKIDAYFRLDPSHHLPLSFLWIPQQIHFKETTGEAHVTSPDLLFRALKFSQ